MIHLKVVAHLSSGKSAVATREYDLGKMSAEEVFRHADIIKKDKINADGFALKYAGGEVVLRKSKKKSWLEVILNLKLVGD